MAGEDPRAPEILQKLWQTHGSYVQEMSDGQNSIIVRSKEDELSACYAIMREAASFIEQQEDELDEDFKVMRILRRHRTEAERASKAAYIAVEVAEERLLEESRLRQEEWREAHVQERIKVYRDRCHEAEEEVARLHKELYER